MVSPNQNEIDHFSQCSILVSQCTNESGPNKKKNFAEGRVRRSRAVLIGQKFSGGKCKHGNQQADCSSTDSLTEQDGAANAFSVIGSNPVLVCQ